MNYIELLKESVENKPFKMLIFTWHKGGPAKAMIPTYEKLKQIFSDKASFKTYYYETNADKFKEFKVRGVPTLLVFKHGKLVDDFPGMFSIEQIIKKLKYLDAL